MLLNYLPIVSQCTKYSFSFTPFLNLWKTKLAEVDCIKTLIWSYFPMNFFSKNIFTAKYRITDTDS